MSESLHMIAGVDRQDEPLYTLQEILQQPVLWPTTVARVRAASEQLSLARRLSGARVLLTGAGSSAYAASSVAAAWPGAIAIPTTDLVVDAERYLPGVGAVISLARSGDSPESAAVVDRVRALHPEILQLAITCNHDSLLAQSGLDSLIVLDPRTNDRSLVMTGSFSNLVLGGLSLAQPELVAQHTDSASESARSLLPAIDEGCQRIAAGTRDRIVVLCSSPLLGWGREAGLKILEMTAGRFPVVTETYLGLRHGPMSFLRPDTFVLCLLSSEPTRRLYEVDLIQELRSKKLGYIVGIAGPGEPISGFHDVLPAVLPEAPDDLRTPFEILIPQLLGYHLSLCLGLNPDNPSPDGVISRVVQGVKIHSAPSNGVGVLRTP
ncbi:MAG: D-galactosamine 6-phosphate deaminase/isomerase [Acidobacteriaceae bacterium]|nr:D-galactosamine 6-phosphate deaminase/isomerase [Acidobacteriaceae bacterium]